MEKDPAARDQIADEIGSIVIAHDGCEGKYLGEAGCNRADVVAAVTGDDEDNLVICQMAKHHFDVPRTIARVNNPKNEALFRHLGVDELISPTRMILGSIEQDIPVHELLHLAALGEGELELIEAHLQAGSPAIGRAPKDLSIPEGCSLFAVIRDGVATPLRPDTVMLEGDKVIAIGKTECQDAAPRPADRRRGAGRRRRLTADAAGPRRLPRSPASSRSPAALIGLCVALSSSVVIVNITSAGGGRPTGRPRRPCSAGAHPGHRRGRARRDPAVGHRTAAGGRSARRRSGWSRSGS